ncbi:MAG: hypothetical protein WC533_00400 [Candidatus Pacearchaeota archaeon]
MVKTEVIKKSECLVILVNILISIFAIAFMIGLESELVSAPDGDWWFNYAKGLPDQQTVDAVKTEEAMTKKEAEFAYGSSTNTPASLNPDKLSWYEYLYKNPKDADLGGWGMAQGVVWAGVAYNEKTKDLNTCNYGVVI